MQGNLPCREWEVFLGYETLSWGGRRSVICYHHVRMPVCPDPIRLPLLSAVILLWWESCCCFVLVDLSHSVIRILLLLNSLSRTLEISRCVFLVHGLFYSRAVFSWCLFRRHPPPPHTHTLPPAGSGAFAFCSTLATFLSFHFACGVFTSVASQEIMRESCCREFSPVKNISCICICPPNSSVDVDMWASSHCL